MTTHQAALCLAVLLLWAPSVPAQGNGRSPLWGHAGEVWNPRGRLPDYSHAGYRGGAAPLPDVPVVADVLEFGAVGNGVTDDTQAFRAAIAWVAQSGAPGAIRVPRGTFRIAQILEVDVDGVVLRGDASGPSGSVLYFSNPGATLTGSATPWIHGQGGLLHFGDRDEQAPGKGGKLTTVTRSQVRGDTRIAVANPGRIAPGDWVILELRDDASGTLALHLHNEQAAGGTCGYMPRPTRWPVQVTAVSGGEVTLAQPLRFDVRPEWTPTLYAYEPVRGVGVESLHLRCKPHAYPGHLLEDGYNPITFDGVLDGWMHDVTIENADNGPSFVNLTKHCTAQNVTLMTGVDAHHGFSFVSASDCLLQDFVVEPVFRHGVTLDHQASGNVTRRGFGTDLNLDHHRDGSFENLFTDLDVGFGTAVWRSGGSSCAGPRAAARNTYWNLRSPSWAAPPDLPTSPEWAQVQSNLLPARRQLQTPDNEWYEVHSALDVSDLYAAQLERRLDLGLTKSRHVVATFEDGTCGELGLEEGAPPVYAQGTAWAGSTGLVRWVEPSAMRADQEILFEVARGMPRGSRAGLLLHASSTSGSLGAGAEVHVERLATEPGKPSGVVPRLVGPSGQTFTGQLVLVDPDAVDLRVRVRVSGERIRVDVQDVDALDIGGVPVPEGGGYTSFFLDAGEDWEALGLRHAQVMAPGDGVDLHVDGNGTLWMSFFEDGFWPGPDPWRFSVSVNGTSLGFLQFVSFVLPVMTNVESLGTHHLTVGFPTSLLEPGDRLRLSHGATDEVWVPWWR